MAKTKLTPTVMLLIAVLILGILFVVFRCKLICNKREGYTRSCLGNDCFGLQRTPVDYAFKNPNGWQRNPHYKANPSDKHQPLDYGPIDFYPDLRKLNKNNGVLFQQYRQDWKGCGKNQVYLTNDSKNRFDLTNIGDQGARVQLDDMYSYRFGKKLPQYNERTFDEPNPYFDKIYGGRHYLTHDKLGD